MCVCVHHISKDQVTSLHASPSASKESIVLHLQSVGDGVGGKFWKFLRDYILVPFFSEGIRILKKEFV